MKLLRLFFFTTALSIAWYYYQTATLVNFLGIGFKLLLLLVVPVQLYHAYKTGFYFGHLKAPCHRGNFKYWLSILNKWLVLVLAWWAIQIATVYVLETEAVNAREHLYGLFTLGLLLVCAFFVRAKIDRLFNVFLLIISIVLGFEVYRAERVPKPAESVILEPPLASYFLIVDGGNSRLNSSMKVKSRESRRYGIYLIAVDQVHAPENWPEPYPNTFGETIIAPAAGRVISIANGMVDTLPGVFKNDGGPGNYIYIKIAEAQYLIIGHLRNGSFLVKEGDQVAIGQPLAEAGKSGSVSIPAVFLAVHTKEDPFDPENRSYPIYFKDVVQIGSGSEPGQFFPNRNDLFKPKPK